MADRQHVRARVEVRPRFRCLVCRRFVEGTAHGSCPGCGWEPPTVALPVERPRPDDAASWWWWGGVVAAVAMTLLYLLA